MPKATFIEAMSKRIRTFLKPHIFYPDLCGRHLKPPLESGLKTKRFRWPDWLVSCGRKADPCKKSMRKNIRNRMDVSWISYIPFMMVWQILYSDTLPGDDGKYKLRGQKIDMAVCFLTNFCPSPSFSLLLLLNFLLSSSAYNLIRSFPKTSCRTNKEGERRRCSEGHSFSVFYAVCA